MTTIKITKFDPISLEMPKTDPIPAGEVVIELPPLKINWGKMNLLDASVTGELPGYGISFTITEPIPLAKMVETTMKMLPTLQALHAEAQAAIARNINDEAPAWAQLSALANYLGKGL